MNPSPDVTVAGFDIETFGKLAGLPSQTCFTPRRCIFIDGVRPSDLVLCAALTLPTFDPRPAPTTPWSGPLIAALRPGPTLIFDFRHPAHIHMLARWLLHLDTIIGMNLPFDISFSRHFSPALANALPPFRHTLLDLSYINYLECELRPERSLKTLGPILSTHVYSDSSLVEKLPDHASLFAYNAEDPHNTILAVSTLASRIVRNYPDSSKLSPSCISHYSDSIHSLTLLSTNGVPLSISRAHSLFSSLSAEASLLETLASSNHNLILSGTGSQKSLDTFLSNLITRLSPLLDYSRLTLTPKTGRVSSDESNRSYLASFLPSSDPDHDALSLITRHSRIQKLLGSYLFPLLFHKKQRKNGRLNRSSLLIPQPGISHPCPLTPPPSSESPPSPASPDSSATSPKARSSTRKRSKTTPSPSKSPKKKAKPSSSPAVTSTPSSATASPPPSSDPSSPSAARPTPKPPATSSSPSTLTNSDLPPAHHPDVPDQLPLPF